MGIELQHVSRAYPARTDSNAGEVRALEDVTFSVGSGEWLAVMGPSGSGKSTLVNLIGCLDRPDSGTVHVEGQNVVDLVGAALDRFRAETIGFVFQQYHLIPYLTALENVMLAQYFHSMTDEQEALEALERVGLADRARHLPAQLSGGEQQRVCIARALINDPKVILADEPTGNLDAVNEEIVMGLLRDLHRQGRTLVMVTHDLVVARMADRRLELHHGRVATHEIYSMPDEELFDEILEEMWVLEENGDRAELGRIQPSGPMPIGLAVERMAQSGLLAERAHPSEPHTHRPSLDRCHEAIHPAESVPEHGSAVIQFTERGRRRAEDIIRRHRLAERLFTETLHLDDEAQIEQQACKFEHILSPEATDKICSFLGHPRTCPHGSPIPYGACCPR
jgi:putative ABC transport system ATP-binding protein